MTATAALIFTTNINNIDVSESPFLPGRGSTRKGRGTFAQFGSNGFCEVFEEVDTELEVSWMMDGFLAPEEEQNNSVEVEVEPVEVEVRVGWDPSGIHRLSGVGLEELHSLIELELGEELRNLLVVFWDRIEVGSLLVAAEVGSLADFLNVEVEVQLQVEVEVGNWAPPR